MILAYLRADRNTNYILFYPYFKDQNDENSRFRFEVSWSA
jgi:hypothetical protein